MYHKIVGGVFVLAALAAGEAPPVEMIVIGKRPPTMLPPVLIFPKDGDVSGDGKLTEVDLTALKAGGETGDAFMRAFNVKLKEVNKARGFDGWIKFETHREPLQFLARTMVEGLLELKEDEALILIYWGGEARAGWSPVSGDQLRAIRTGKSCFQFNQKFGRWDYVDTVPAVPLDPAKRPTT